MAQITMSEVRKRFPQYKDIDDDRLLEALRQRYYSDISPEQFSAMVVRDLGPPEAKLTDDWRRNTMRSMAGARLKNMSYLPKAFLNIGSGVQELVTGAQQRYNDLFGDEERGAELRRRAADERALAETLAANTTGGGALQVAGNVLPTLAIPAGVFSNVAMRAGTFLPRAYRALRTGWAMAPAATTTARLGSIGLVGDSVLAGMTYGALRPTVEGESALQNMAMGGATNALLPGGAAIFNTGRRMVTRGGGGERAAEQIVDDLAGEGADQATRQSVLQQTLGQLRGGQQGPIRLSSAAQLDSADLARLERGSRARNAANWSEFDELQAREVADQVTRATRESQMLSQRQAKRRAGWKEDWAKASGSAELGEFAGDLAKFRNSLDDAMLQPDASNPAVRNMLKTIADDIDRIADAGVPYTPGHLQQIRANMAAKFSPLNPNALAGAPRDSASRIATMQQIDDILNRATGGKYQTVLDNYARRSRLVDQSKAAGRVRDTFYDADTGRVLGTSADAAGDVPKVTEAALGRAMNRARGKDGASQLSSRAKTRLNAVLDALRRQNITQRIAKTATAGGGSNTASDTIAAEAAAQVGDTIAGAAGVPSWVSRLGLSRLEDAATANRDRALAEALQNPDELRRILERLERSGQPLSPEQSVLLNVLRGSAAGAVGN